MALNSKRKFAIFAGTSKCLVYAEAKYCASEMPGEIKYYECSRSEYCCALGCCTSPGLHFHHLWYYWILVIIMFLVCSGGGWWYRYWLQGRYRAAASAIPSTSSNSRPQNALRGSTCQAQRARISYNSARNTVLLHRMWKGPRRNGAAPAYNSNATTSTHYQQMNVLLNDAHCPYYQFYGPPPSYETVIAQSRGKLSNPASPESSNTRTSLQTSPNIITNPSVAQCFSYACNPSIRMNNVPEALPPYQSVHGNPGDPQESIPYYPQYCGSTGTPMRQNVCLSYEYQEQALVPRDIFSHPCQSSSTSFLPYSADKLSDISDPESQGYEASSNAGEGYTATLRKIDQGPSGSGERVHWELTDPALSILQNRTEKSVTGGRLERITEQRERRERRDIIDNVSSLPSTSKVEEIRKNVTETLEDNVRSSRSLESRSLESRSLESRSLESRSLESRRVFLRQQRGYGGSLKLAGNFAGNTRLRDVSLKNLPRSCEGITSYGEGSVNTIMKIAPRRAASDSANPFESDPSNYVILEPFSSDGATTSNIRADHTEISANGSTNSTDESKPRLDRSKSLD